MFFAALLAGYSFFRLQENNGLENIIRSDGRGYYAYLPALFVFNDPTYASSERAEQTDREYRPGNFYLSTDREGTVYNKYFPGVALMQAPFFGVGHLCAKLTGGKANGYSFWYQFWFFAGAMCYMLAGLYFFVGMLKRMFPMHFPKYAWIIPLIYASSPLLFYLTETPGFSHLYSFFLFALFGNLLLGLIHEPVTARRMFLFGVVYGVIILVRPTNATVILAIPLLTASWKGTKEFVQKITASRKKFFVGFLGFLLIMFLLPATWKWETGNWILWSYSGEGFNFLSPRILEVLFSFRIGLFIHHPVYILIAVSVVFLYRQDRFKAVSWLLYFLVNTWIISAWWCWDYESSFGVRPFVEHTVFLSLPFFMAGITRKYMRGLFVAAAVLGTMRKVQYDTGAMEIQRFTAKSYFASLAWWDASNFGRWNFTRSCPPYGKRQNTYWLFVEKEAQRITKEQEFLCVGEIVLDSMRTYGRYYYAVDLEKKVGEFPFENVTLVVDAWDEQSELRNYGAVELFNDRLEGNGKWEKLRFEGIIHDQLRLYDRVKIYIWNRNPHPYFLRNVEIKLETYGE